MILALVPSLKHFTVRSCRDTASLSSLMAATMRALLSSVRSSLNRSSSLPAGKKPARVTLVAYDVSHLYLHYVLSIYVGQKYVIVPNLRKMAPGALIGQVLRFPFPESLPQKKIRQSRGNTLHMKKIFSS